MDENPYRAPVGVQKMRRRLPEFLRLPTSFIEWAVIVLVIAAMIAVFLPNVDESAQSARKVEAHQPAPTGP
jgi:hypothetical protein